MSRIKQAMARAMLVERDASVLARRREILEDLYKQIPAERRLPVGRAAAALAGGLRPAEASDFEKVLALIDEYGIPEARMRLEYRTKRKSDRTPLTSSRITGAVGDTEFAAWLVDVGKGTRNHRWNSFLAYAVNPGPQLLAGVKRGEVRLNSLDGTDLSSCVCEVKRVAVKCGDTDEGERFYFACNVPPGDIATFSKVVKRAIRSQ